MNFPFPPIVESCKVNHTDNQPWRSTGGPKLEHRTCAPTDTHTHTYMYIYTRSTRAGHATGFILIALFCSKSSSRGNNTATTTTTTRLRISSRLRSIRETGQSSARLKSFLTCKAAASSPVYENYTYCVYPRRISKSQIDPAYTRRVGYTHEPAVAALLCDRAGTSKPSRYRHTYTSVHLYVYRIRAILWTQARGHASELSQRLTYGKYILRFNIYKGTIVTATTRQTCIRSCKTREPYV
uniref:Uncharacterized protein n=1 Tax=Trichogramma kaykai TaxID=54128 RepID=A0ABD2XG04_9HYME